MKTPTCRGVRYWLVWSINLSLLILLLFLDIIALQRSFVTAFLSAH